MDKYPEALSELIKRFQKLPGVGKRSAERYAFHMLDMPKGDTHALSEALLTTLTKLQQCALCGALSDCSPCPLCTDSTRQTDKLCVVSHWKDIFNIERTGEWKGLYHVLGGVLSPLEGIGPESLRLLELKQRLESPQIKEVVIAIDSTLEGDTTALYLKEELQQFSVHVSRLAFGMPIGSSLEHVDGGTLAQAFSGRKSF
jgi:recombination protein RecR